MYGPASLDAPLDRPTHHRLPPPSGVPVAYRAPFDFGGECYRDVRPHGESILQIVMSIPKLPTAFLTQGFVCLNGEVIPRHMWDYVRPKPTCEYLPIAVTLHFPLQGGGGSGGSNTTKSIVAIVAAVALIIVTQGIASGAVFGSLGTIGFGITGAQVLAGAVGIAGALAISALTAPPTTSTDSASGGDNTDNKEPAGAGGNVLEPGGPILRVIGTRKVFPPLVCEPIVDLVDDNEYVEALFALNGPHALNDIRIDGSSTDSVADVTVETREGWAADSALTSIVRYGRTLTANIQLSQHTVNVKDSLTLTDQATPTNSLPISHRLIGRDTPDEMWMHLVFPGGLIDNSALTAQRSVPFRIRIRKRGAGSWYNLPELHYSNSSNKQVKVQIRFFFTTQPGALPAPPTSIGFIGAWRSVPAQTVGPTDAGAQWTADGYFDDGAGSESYVFGTEGSTRVRNLYLYDDRVSVWLDPATFTAGMWEIEIRRGETFTRSNLNTSTYSYSGNILNFFKYATIAGIHKIHVVENNVVSTCVVTRLVSVWNSAPFAGTKFALIAIRARNRQIQRVSVSASGYVQDWGGSAWDTWTTTSNPAPHYVDILSGEQNLDPLDADLRDDTGLVAWRTLCNSNGWEVDAIMDDKRTDDALDLVASCGYARRYQSDQYGVTVDNDRTGNTPVQVFSRINSRNMRYERAFTKMPEGFIVTYRDEQTDDDRAQLIVYQRDTSLATTGMFESVSYDGIVEAHRVRARALFDLDQANLRATFYTLETDVENLVCRRGSLVGLQHDIISNVSGDAHIKSKVISAGNITGFVLDSKITIPAGTNGITIRRNNGNLSTHQISTGAGTVDTIALTTPFADTTQILGFANTNHNYGCMIVFGTLASTYKRMLVQSIQPGQDLTATMVLVDEAPALDRQPEIT